MYAFIAWCKNALRWLEDQQERQLQRTEIQQIGSAKKGKKTTRKTSKKVQRNKTDRVPPPPANANSDITCMHDQLQYNTSVRSSRARRRLLDKHAWKVLRALYPESTCLPVSNGECVQCRAESCQSIKAIQDAQELAKQQRKLPLQNPNIRRFYTRTRGFPEHCLKDRQQQQQALQNSNNELEQEHDYFNVDIRREFQDDCKISAICTTPIAKKTVDLYDDNDDMYQTLSSARDCPLMDGCYYVLPRSWCRDWRKFIKTGEGGTSATMFAAPDAAGLLCDAHRMALLPPHLEAYLYGKSSVLLAGIAAKVTTSSSSNSNVETITTTTLPVGQGPTEDSIAAMRELGLGEQEITLQLNAMRAIEARRERFATTTHATTISDGG